MARATKEKKKIDGSRHKGKRKKKMARTILKHLFNVVGRLLLHRIADPEY